MLRKQQQQINNIQSKPLNVFDSLKSLSLEAKDLMDEIEDGNDDINNGKFLFIGSNKKHFKKLLIQPLNFISAIYNGKISLKEAKIYQRKMQRKIEELNGYRPENAEEKEEINGVLMQTNDLLEYRD